MSQENGRLTHCDRCGYTVFSKVTGEGETDGGFTRWNKFEPLPDGWDFHAETGMLCPNCNSSFHNIINTFMGRDTNEKCTS